jgi:hypothetical protein
LNLKIGNKSAKQAEESGEFDHYIQIIVNSLYVIKNKALKNSHVDARNSDF